MNRSTPMRRTGFNRKRAPVEIAVVDQTGDMGELLAPLTRIRSLHKGVYGRAELVAYPKQPADRNQAVRDMAMGEDCQVRYAPVCRHPATEYTVWAHSNTQADRKGMGYKASDSAGIGFACDRCHEVIDRRLLPPMQIEEISRGARERTLIRCRFIANDPTERAWRVRAAKWLLDRARELVAITTGETQ